MKPLEIPTAYDHKIWDEKIHNICQSLEKISILPLIISATGIVRQSLFKDLKILDLENKLVVEIQKGILLYSCHIVRKFLNIDTEHNTQQSQNAEARRQ
jgi:hypothetical protein